MPDNAQRIAENRRKFRERWIPHLYSGPAHGLFIFAICLYLSTFCFSKVRTWDVSRWLALAGFFIFANVSTYLSHRYPQHHPMKFQKFLYWFHTQEHHNLFTHEHMERESWRDAYMVFFPPSVVSTLILIFCLEGWIVSKIAGTDFGFLCTGTLSAYYLLYEFVHFASHSSKNAFFYKIPVLRFLTRHHRIHHDPRIMSRYNFDIAFPMSDWIFGTLKKTAPDEST